MINDHVNTIKTLVGQLKNKLHSKEAHDLELDKCERIAQKLDSYAGQCKDCLFYLNELEEQLTELNIPEMPTKEDKKYHKNRLRTITNHLQGTHKLVPSGHYVSLYMTFGTSLGILFGQLFMNNLAMGLSLGIGIGVAIGAGLDSNAKKNGLTL